MAFPLPIPLAVMADSYKATHFEQYPNSSKMVAYGEFRWGFEKNTADTRIVHFGVRHLLETYLLRQWTTADVDAARKFYAQHAAGGAALPWPEHLFTKIVEECNGYFPVKFEALPPGTVTHARVPAYQITASGEFAPLCTFLETLLTHTWYPSTVATLSRRARDCIEAAFETGAEGGRDSPLLPSRLHDFGMRGCTSLEQAVIGGTAHLLSFEGTDTMPAAYYAQYHLNDGKPVAFSIPATEHSVMTSWPTERAAIMNMIEKFGSGVFACVMDSYDYVRALEATLPSVASEKVGKGGFMVLRPDSGDPVQAVLQALHAADKVFSSDVNSRGYKVLRGCGVIQGDGINIHTMADILAAVLAEGFSPECIAFGMGAGLLQRVHRDTMGFATKLCYIEPEGAEGRDVMKCPLTDASKISLPGVLAVKRVQGVPTVFPAEAVGEGENMLQVVYDCGPVEVPWESFEAVRARVASEWSALAPTANVISSELSAKIEACRQSTQERALAAQ